MDKFAQIITFVLLLATFPSTRSKCVCNFVQCSCVSAFFIVTTTTRRFLQLACIVGQTTVSNTIPRRGTVRLVRDNITSTTHSSGRVQIYINSRWGQICDDFQFSITEAAVICHQLGFSGASSLSRAAVDTLVKLPT